MSASNFDTLAYLQELKRSGMNENEAEAITKATAKAFSQVIDLKEIGTKSDFRQLEAVLKKEMSDNKLELVKYLTDSKAELVKNIHETKLELIKHTNDTMWKTIGMLSLLQGLIIGAFGLIQYCIKVTLT